MSNQKLKRKKLMIRSLKIAVGSLFSIWAATSLGMEFAASAGIVTLLSVVSTKWDTVKLSLARIVTFFVSVVVAYISFSLFRSEWIAYGVYIFIVVLGSHLVGWESTISVNAVIGTHFLSTMNFTPGFILNEFLLVVLGASVAVVLNLINGNRSQQQKLVKDMEYVEVALQTVLGEMEDYLRHAKMNRNVWQDIIDLENHLEHSIERAYEYKGNTFIRHSEYYVNYMEMRMKQCNVLHNLHYEVKKIRELPEEAQLVADTVSFLRSYVKEHSLPKKQQKKIQESVEILRNAEIPVNKEELDSRIILYHILKDLEEVIVFKKRFIETLSEKQKEVYVAGEGTYLLNEQGAE